jgi:hypothetical protein
VPNNLLRSLSLLDPSGYVIIAIILMLLAASTCATVVIRARYASLARELRRHGGADAGWQSAVLRGITQDAQTAASLGSRDINTQAIIDQNFQRELGALLMGERFIKASTGLFIILGLVGTFYGLTLSIGRLVSLVSTDATNTGDIAQSLMTGLTQALSGMSVAFSCSLFGIVSAIVMTLLGVFFNVADRRTALMVQIEAYVDNELLTELRVPVADRLRRGEGSVAGEPIDASVAAFGASVAQLQSVVEQFEASLSGFATNTRDFQEFNLHLKDNIARMSVAFGDLSDTLHERTTAFKGRG